MTRRLSLVIAVLTLGIGPWLGLPAAPTLSVSPAASFAEGPEGPHVRGQVSPTAAPQARHLSRATGCTCREVVVEASNVVRDAEVRTGDAEVVNRSITYVAPSYEDTDVDVNQEAEAFSGDAVAGQILGVDAGDGCSNVRVSATNIVEDAEVRSGDAVARNESLILIDPAIKREDLEIEVEQDAVAESGDAVAGQIIGVQGGGPCGGVILDALNRVRDVELRTGETTTENLSDILTCKDVACIDDVRRFLRDVDEVEVCNADGCDSVPVEEFIEMLEEQAGSSDRDRRDRRDDDDADEENDDEADEDDDESDEEEDEDADADEEEDDEDEEEEEDPSETPSPRDAATPEPGPTPTPTMQPPLV